MVYIPKPDGRAKRLSFIFIVSGIIIWMLSSLGIAFRIAAQIAAVAVIAAGLQLLVRYVLSGFNYVIRDDGDGGSDFLIYKTQGSRTIKVCDIPLDKAIAVFRPGNMPDYSEKFGQVSNRFNYCQNPGKKLAYSLLFNDRDKLIEVRFEPDVNFARELNRRTPPDCHFSM